MHCQKILTAIVYDRFLFMPWLKPRTFSLYILVILVDVVLDEDLWWWGWWEKNNGSHIHNHENISNGSWSKNSRYKHSPETPFARSWGLCIMNVGGQHQWEARERGWSIRQALGQNPGACFWIVRVCQSTVSMCSIFMGWYGTHVSQYDSPPPPHDTIIPGNVLWCTAKQYAYTVIVRTCVTLGFLLAWAKHEYTPLQGRLQHCAVRRFVKLVFNELKASLKP